MEISELIFRHESLMDLFIGTAENPPGKMMKMKRRTESNDVYFVFNVF